MTRSPEQSPHNTHDEDPRARGLKFKKAATWVLLGAGVVAGGYVAGEKLSSNNSDTPVTESSETIEKGGYDFRKDYDTKRFDDGYGQAGEVPSNDTTTVQVETPTYPNSDSKDTGSGIGAP